MFYFDRRTQASKLVWNAVVSSRPILSESPVLVPSNDPHQRGILQTQEESSSGENVVAAGRFICERASVRRERLISSNRGGSVAGRC